jgi:hypothetical protein
MTYAPCGTPRNHAEEIANARYATQYFDCPADDPRASRITPEQSARIAMALCELHDPPDDLPPRNVFRWIWLGVAVVVTMVWGMW